MYMHIWKYQINKWHAAALSTTQSTKQTHTAFSISVYQHGAQNTESRTLITLFLLYDENSCHMWCSMLFVVVDIEPFLLNSRFKAAAFPFALVCFQTLTSSDLNDYSPLRLEFIRNRLICFSTNNRNPLFLEIRKKLSELQVNKNKYKVKNTIRTRERNKYAN